MTYPEFIEEWKENTDFIKVHTSGSTGTPKEILLPRLVMTQSGARTIRYFNLNTNSHFHSCISPDFIGGKMMVVRAETLGAKLTWETPSNHPDLVCEEGGRRLIPDFIAVVPSQLRGILDLIRSDHLTEDERRKLCGTTIFLCGGAPLCCDLAEKVNDAGMKVYESYGMTETSSHIALRKAGDRHFMPLDGVSICKDARECLVIEVPGLNKIYTNDIVDLETNSQFKILGRVDNVINSGGKKIFPEEIESTLLPLLAPFGITAVMAYGKSDPLWGQALHLDIEYQGPEEEAIISRCAEITAATLPSWKRPKGIHIVGHIPRTENGKILRNKLVNYSITH